jgi:hypothetical protein
VLLRLSSDFRRAMDLSLVLEQEGIRHELRRVNDAHWGLEIDDTDAARAEAAIAAFEQENPPEVRRPQGVVHPTTGAVASGVAFALALVTFYIRTGPESAGSAWFERGSADAAAILPRPVVASRMPVVGGLALLAFLGTSKRADVAGHLCGFVSGVLAGAAVSVLPPLRNRAAQASLAVAAACVPMAAWLAAFR